MVDAFFKKPDYVIRFSDEGVDRMISQPNAAFLVACTDEGDVAGSIYLTWEGESMGETEAKVRFCVLDFLVAIDKTISLRGNSPPFQCPII